MEQEKYAVPDGAFTDLDGAGGLNVAQYVRLGRYVALVREVRYLPKAGRNKIPATVIEMDVLACLSAPETWADGEPGKSVPHTPHSVGDRITDFINMAKVYAAQALNSFIGCCMGVDPRKVGPEHAATVCGPTQPVAGTILLFNAFEKENESGTVVYSRVNYERVVPAAELADILDEAGIRVLGGEAKLAEMVEAETAA